MSSKAKIVIIFSSIAMALLIAAGIVFGSYYGNRQEYMIDEHVDFDLTDVGEINLNCLSIDVQIVASDDMYATLEGTIWSTKEKEQYLDVYKKGDTLYIEVDREYQLFTWPSDMDLAVFIPADNEKDMTLSCSSGNVEIADMHFGDMQIKQSSGNAKVIGCEADSVCFNSSSGNMDFARCDYSDIRLRSSSGHVTVLDTPADMTIKSTSGSVSVAGSAGDITIESTSGDVRLEDADGEISVNCTSGDVTIDMASADISPVTVRITSGDLRLYMLPDTAFDFEAETTSGDIESDIKILVAGVLGQRHSGDDVQGNANGGGPLIRVKTTSGDVSIIGK